MAGSERAKESQGQPPVIKCLSVIKFKRSRKFGSQPGCTANFRKMGMVFAIESWGACVCLCVRVCVVVVYSCCVFLFVCLLLLRVCECACVVFVLGR